MFEILPGQLVFFPENVRHAMFTDERQALKLIMVHFIARVFGSVDAVEFLNLSGPHCVGSDTELPALLETMAREHMMKPMACRESLNARTLLLLLYAIRHFSAEAGHELKLKNIRHFVAGLRANLRTLQSARSSRNRATLRRDSQPI